jgi:hypothetical protein
MKVALSDHEQKHLREQRVISEHEIVYRVGDLYVAEHVLNGEKRQIHVGALLSENNKKRVLKG